MASKKYKIISLEEQTLRECDVMLKHASSMGRTFSPSLISKYQNVANKVGELSKLKVKHDTFLSNQEIKLSLTDVEQLHSVHNDLSSLVSPATPYTLLFMQTDSQNGLGLFRMFGSVPLVRRMFFVTFLCLGIMLGFSFLDNATELITNPLLSNERENILLAVLFRLSAAGIGASFYLLYKAKSYIGNNTYHPRFEETYWYEFGMGLMSGLIFSTFFDGQNIEIGAVANSEAMNKILIALLGGFSTSVVYEFLTRMVNAMASVFKPDVTKVFDLEKEKLQNKFEQVIADKKQTVLSHLTDLQADVFNGDFSKEGIGERLRDLVQDLSDTGAIPATTRKVVIPKDIPSSNDVKIDIENIDPLKYEAIHPDDINEATEEEYVTIFDTRA